MRCFKRPYAALLGAALTLMTPDLAAAAPKPKSASAKPKQTAFQQEQALTPAQLLNRWSAPVAKASKRFGVPAAWINAVMRMESGGRTMLGENQRMISDKGAQGLMQLLPQTYGDMRAQYGLGADAFDPQNNIYAGTAYLKWLRGKYAYPALFAAYNAGPGQVDNLLTRGKALPAETRTYIAGIGAILDGKAGGGRFAKLTRPDGTPALIDPVAVRGVRGVLAGEYVEGVQTVIDMGVLKQGVTEDVATAVAAIRIRGGRI